MTTANPGTEDMVKFAARWYRLGGGPSEEVHARFGMDDREFFERMNNLMGSGDGLDSVAPRDAEVMRAVFRRRLWLAT